VSAPIRDPGGYAGGYSYQLTLNDRNGRYPAETTLRSLSDYRTVPSKCPCGLSAMDRKVSSAPTPELLISFSHEANMNVFSPQPSWTASETPPGVTTPRG